MATAVERALEEERVLLCEAGTGTGKTLAYLVPALLSRQKVVVSTASKALQEQILFKDLPLIEQHLGLQVKALLVKGLNNYLCLRRFDELRGSSAAVSASGESLAGDWIAFRQALPLVSAWAAETSTGDIAELTELPEAHPIWEALTSSSETRLGSRCPYYSDCHVTHLKRAAERADLLIVNHHLFFADLAIKGAHLGGALPPYDAVVLDEAHKIEDIATSFFGTTVTSSSVERLLRETDRALRAADRSTGSEPSKTIARTVQLARQLFARLLAALSSRIGRPPVGREPLPVDVWTGELLESYFEFDNAVDELHSCVAVAATDETLRLTAGRLASLREDLARVVEPTRAQVSWLEARAKTVGITASPVTVGPMLRDKLFHQGGTIVMTSASLTANGGFAFVRARLGLDEAITTAVDELVVASALDHSRQALLYTPTDLPEVSHDDFVPLATERIAELLSITCGGAFVLCTSIRAMKAFATGLANSIQPPLGELTLLVQGEAPKNALLERFRRANDAVLVATMSFWEGVDVPGQALRLVVIDRLPFAVPTDPIVAARCAALRDANRDPFTAYSVPQAAIVLKQGFGRLLRTRNDFGVVAVLDRRIRNRRYGKVMLTSLPEARLTAELEDVADFWTSRSGADPILPE